MHDKIDSVRFGQDRERHSAAGSEEMERQPAFGLLGVFNMPHDQHNTLLNLLTTESVVQLIV